MKCGEQDAYLEHYGDEKIGREAEPYHLAGAAQSVDLHHAVSDDIRHGEYHHSGRDGQRPGRDGLDFHEVGRDEAHAERHCQQQKRH